MITLINEAFDIKKQPRAKLAAIALGGLTGYGAYKAYEELKSNTRPKDLESSIKGEKKFKSAE